MANDKITMCKTCGYEISGKGKVVCPSCGRVNKKPIYKRVWFIVLMAIIVLTMFANMGTSDSTLTEASSSLEKSKTDIVEEEKVPIVLTVDELAEQLDSNALKASNMYKNQYVELTGRLTVIDSSGDYFALSVIENKFSLENVHCSISEEHIDQVMEFKDDQEITVIGTITDVGELMGYFLEVESIK